ncbi:MAG TPA: hypothetical protein VD838_08740 [Anaeromyxobacteraceae bacterium]|nr:hypothetical protein [Anaeromyxobacteraceae bacterium]
MSERSAADVATLNRYGVLVMHHRQVEAFLRDKGDVLSLAGSMAKLDALVSVFGWTVTIVADPTHGFTMRAKPPSSAPDDGVFYESIGLVPVVNNAFADTPLTKHFDEEVAKLVGAADAILGQHEEDAARRDAP